MYINAAGALYFPVTAYDYYYYLKYQFDKILATSLEYLVKWPSLKLILIYK